MSADSPAARYAAAITHHSAAFREFCVAEDARAEASSAQQKARKMCNLPDDPFDALVAMYNAGLADGAARVAGWRALTAEEVSAVLYGNIDYRLSDDHAATVNQRLAVLFGAPTPAESASHAIDVDAVRTLLARYEEMRAEAQGETK